MVFEIEHLGLERHFEIIQLCIYDVEAFFRDQVDGLDGERQGVFLDQLAGAPCNQADGCQQLV
ncbi:hypothetical protein [Desulfococcus sp.]|uniref:hypothetical protein n=1 Tax=Desulfococcus sp. TaxID=2025834 RepID=UPI0035948789